VLKRIRLKSGLDVVDRSAYLRSEVNGSHGELGAIPHILAKLKDNGKAKSI
jgi:hypothetical protein